jgi:hypothetical protein
LLKVWGQTKAEFVTFAAREVKLQKPTKASKRRGRLPSLVHVELMYAHQCIPTRCVGFTI